MFTKVCMVANIGVSDEGRASPSAYLGIVR